MKVRHFFQVGWSFSSWFLLLDQLRFVVQWISQSHGPVEGQKQCVEDIGAANQMQFAFHHEISWPESHLTHFIHMSDWLVVGPPLWKIWVRPLGWWMQSNIHGKIKKMPNSWQPVTTNQLSTWVIIHDSPREFKKSLCLFDVSVESTHRIPGSVDSWEHLKLNERLQRVLQAAHFCSDWKVSHHIEAWFEFKVFVLCESIHFQNYIYICIEIHMKSK